MWPKSVSWTRESLRLEGLLETKNLELVDKFVILWLLYPVCSTDNKVRIHICIYNIKELAWWLSGKESPCQCRRHWFDLWSRKITWRGKWQQTPVFLPGKPHRQRSLWATDCRVAKSQIRLSDWRTTAIYNVSVYLCLCMYLLAAGFPWMYAKCIIMVTGVFLVVRLPCCRRLCDRQYPCGYAEEVRVIGEGWPQPSISQDDSFTLTLYLRV